MSGSTPATEGPSWVAVARSADVGAEPHRVPFGERPWILLRLEGTLVGFADRCPHRFAPLSAGRAVDGTLECGFHGWRFDASGRAVAIPSLGPDAVIPPRACLTHLPVREEDGVVFIAPGAVPREQGRLDIGHTGRP
jgi:phenylpropionate dioxygenase-like ring-hydroxylating dioxygenase large terminal subunit